MRPFIFTKQETKLRRSMMFKRWYARNVLQQRDKSRSFHRDNPALSASRCKSWRLRNPEKNREARNRWAKANPDRVRESARKSKKKSRTNNLVYALKCRLRCRFNMALRKRAKAKKSKSVIKLAGCTIHELQAHLSSQFQSGMTWGNHGTHGWHIDHIKPCRDFDLTDPEQQAACFHFSNLRPLWAWENVRRNSKSGRPRKS